MTGGANGSETFVIQTVQTAFKFHKFGLASAMAVVLLVHHPARHLDPATDRARREGGADMTRVQRRARPSHRPAAAAVAKYLSLGRRQRGRPAAAGGHPDGVAEDRATSSANGRAVRPAGELVQLRQLRDRVHRRQHAPGFVNTTIILVVSLVGTILIGTMAAYAIDRFEFRFKKLVVGLFLLATLVPGVTTQVATFQVVNALDLFNTRWSAIVLFLGTDIIAIYIFMQFMRASRVSLDEAAMLDGAEPVHASTGGSSCRC